MIDWLVRLRPIIGMILNYSSAGNCDRVSIKWIQKNKRQASSFGKCFLSWSMFILSPPMLFRGSNNRYLWQIRSQWCLIFGYRSVKKWVAGKSNLEEQAVVPRIIPTRIVGDAPWSLPIYILQNIVYTKANESPSFFSVALSSTIVAIATSMAPVPIGMQRTRSFLEISACFLPAAISPIVA